MTAAGYVVANLAALAALSSTSRLDGSSRKVRTNIGGQTDWYTFCQGDTRTPDGYLIIAPTDNPSDGNWIKDNYEYSFTGEMVCNSTCSTAGTGKAFQFYAPYANLPLIIQPGFDISITTGAVAIQLHKWNQAPNDAMIGREFVAALPSTGGVANVEIDSTNRWISIFAQDPGNSDQYVGACIAIAGNIITLVGFS